MRKRFSQHIISLSVISLTALYSHAGPGTYHGFPLANPHLAILPVDSQPNYDYWSQSSSNLSSAFDKSKSLDAKSIVTTQVDQVINEQESNELIGGNDTKESAQSINLDYGQLAGIYGTLTINQAPQVFIDSFTQSNEINDTVNTATTLNMSSQNIKQQVNGSLSDGQTSSSGRDYDIHNLTNLNPHWPLFIEYQANEFSDAVISFADQDLQQFISYTPEFDSVLPFFNHFESNLYVAVGGAPIVNEEGYHDPSSRNGYSTLANYDISFYQPEIDLDYYNVELNEGDLLSIASNYSNILLQIESPLERFVATYSPLGFIYPTDSPAIRTGASNIAYTATESGTHTIIVKTADMMRHSADYEVLVQREAMSAEQLNNGEPQIVFLDFDGATLNGLPFNGINENITLSGLSQYLANFELQPSDESQLTQEIIDVFTGHFETLLNSYTGSGTPQISILNSAQHEDPFGQDNVSRIIIGGSINELKLATIGIAQSLDPGNFNRQETGIVLLDLLSSEDDQNNSLNFLNRDESVSKINLIASSIGTIAAHELGHILSGFHTNNRNDTHNIMDAGGDSHNRLGTGEDKIFGTSDDAAVLFQTDQYDTNLDYFGEQNTVDQIAQGLRVSSQTSRSGSSDGFLGVGTPSLWLIGLTFLVLLTRKKRQP